MIDPLLAFLGAPETPRLEDAARVAELERQLGQRLPAETRDLLLHMPELSDPDAAGHPEIDELDFFAGLPDVGAWLERLASGLEGPLLACSQFFGLIPLAVRRETGDFGYAMAGLDGAIYRYDERELGLLAPSASHFLAAEIARFRERADAPYDCYRLAIDPAAEPPPVGEPPAAGRELDGRSRWWICAALRGELAFWALDAIPTPEVWEAGRAAVARDHGDAMFWLLAHAILGNRDELAEAARLSTDNPSRLVAALRAYLESSPGFIDRHREWRDGLYDLARRAQP